MTTATNMAQNAKDAASNVADKAKNVANDVANRTGQIASTVGEKADSAAASVGSGMKSVADTIRDHVPEKGMLGEAGKSIASAIESGGRFLEDKKLSGMGDEVTNLIKNHPVPAVLLALGLGYLIAISTRG